MRRDHYKIFSPGRIGPLTLPNRLVRSATWDPSILKTRQMTPAVLDIYRRLAAGGVGLIIAGDIPVAPQGLLDRPGAKPTYEEVRITGFEQLVDVVRAAAPDCKLMAQISVEIFGYGPSDFPSPCTTQPIQPLSSEQIHTLVACFVEAIAGLQAQGFDGVQLHAAHGGLLSYFLSPYTNRRRDAYGGSVANRARILREIVSQARQRVGDFPLLIKMNATDYLEGGIDLDNFSQHAREVQRCGFDALEISGGMWECLVRPAEELGFRPVPMAESHTRLRNPDRQSYFLPYAEALDLDVPIILVGGNRDVERLEQILQQGRVDFVALCRPLLNEPDLPNRWREGRGSSGTRCISCNSCIYDMFTSLDRGEPSITTCIYQHDRPRVKAAQRWLSTWVQENTLR
jgi:2,4-dienoyl-CoA reductase-like NADH-dependent reductase (Old Yellow Enzyme family)